MTAVEVRWWLERVKDGTAYFRQAEYVLDVVKKNGWKGAGISKESFLALMKQKAETFYTEWHECNWYLNDLRARVEMATKHHDRCRADLAIAA